MVVCGRKRAGGTCGELGPVVRPVYKRRESGRGDWLERGSPVCVFLGDVKSILLVLYFTSLVTSVLTMTF